jgi:hypothetical protein
MKLKKIQLYRRIKKIAIKRIMIKIKIQNKFYFWLKGEVEKKIQFNKVIQKKLKQSKE